MNPSHNLNVQKHDISEVDWDYFSGQGPNYLYSPHSLSVYQNLDLLIVSHQQKPLAVWPVPYSWTDGKKIAKRDIRLLPYHPPLLVKDHLVDQRRFLSLLLEYLKENYFALDLPLAPHFHHTSLFSASGIYVEWRNTHLFTSSHPVTDNFHSKVSNHIRNAKKKVSLEWGHPFDFQKGIITDNPLHRESRKNLTLNLLNSGMARVLTAFNETKIEGQAVVVHDQRTAYLFHSWYEKQSTRGVPSYLIEAISNWALNEQGLLFFDLEGSILPSVDRFFANFGGLQTPYAYVIWCQDKDMMLNMIKESVFMPIRLHS